MGPSAAQLCAKCNLVCVCGMSECSSLFLFPSTEKKSDGKGKYFLPASPSKPVAPTFLQGLSDLRVMDGSQVTMTVQLSGLSLYFLGACENGHGCCVTIASRHPTQITEPPISLGPPVHPRSETSWSPFSAFSSRIFWIQG